MKLSVIIPIYNVQDYLAVCLDSVIVPGLPDYEIVAVNDGSTDSSGAILADYAARYPDLIRPVTTENGGLGHARNTGMAIAGGEYFLFLDSDDFLAPGALKEILAVLDGSFDIGLFDFITVNPDGRELRRDRGCEREGAFRFSDFPAVLLSPPNAFNKLWRSALFRESGIRFPDRQWFEDLATIPRLYLRAQTLRYFPAAWHRYLKRPGSITNSPRVERNREMLDAVEAFMADYTEQGAAGKYRGELEAMAAYHELLTSSTRVALVDPRSPVLDALREDFLARFPDWRSNPYVRGWPKKHLLLAEMIGHRQYRLLHLLLKLNQLKYR